MALSEISKQFKIIRIMTDITRPQMAKTLGIPEKELVLIEQGKSQVTDALLQKIATTFGGEGEDVILGVLREAAVKSVESIEFDMKNLSLEQRKRVVQLRDEITEENAAELEKQEKEKQRLREEKAALRKQKRAEKEVVAVEEEPVPVDELDLEVPDQDPDPESEPEKEKVVSDTISDEDKLSDDEMMALLSLED